MLHNCYAAQPFRKFLIQDERQFTCSVRPPVHNCFTFCMCLTTLPGYCIHVYQFYVNVPYSLKACITSDIFRTIYMKWQLLNPSVAITAALHSQNLLFVTQSVGQNTNHAVIKVAKHTNEIGTAYINHDLSLAILSAQFTYSHDESDKLPRNSPGLQGWGKRRQPYSGFKRLGVIQKGGLCTSIRILVECQILGMPWKSRGLRVLACRLNCPGFMAAVSTRNVVRYYVSCLHHITQLFVGREKCRPLDISAVWQLIVYRLAIRRHELRILTIPYTNCPYSMNASNLKLSCSEQ